MPENPFLAFTGGDKESQTTVAENPFAAFTKAPAPQRELSDLDARAIGEQLVPKHSGIVTPVDYDPRLSPESQGLTKEQGDAIRAGQTVARLQSQRDVRERRVAWGGRSVPAAKIEEVAQLNGVSPEAIMRLGTWQGRLESRIAKTPVGQTLLRTEQGFWDLASTGVSLVSRATGDDETAREIHKENVLRDEFLNLAERGGDIDYVLGEKGRSIYNGAVRSIANISGPGAVGKAALFSVIGAQGFDDALNEAEEIGLDDREGALYATHKAASEVAITWLFGRAAERLGLGSLEETLSRGTRAAVQKIAKRTGLRDKLVGLVKGAGGAAAEGAEEALVDGVHQVVELSEGLGDAYDFERTFLAAGTGVAATGIAKGLQQTLKKAKPFIEDTVAGTRMAEETLRHVSGKPPVVEAARTQGPEPGTKEQLVREMLAKRKGAGGRGHRMAQQLLERATPEMLDEFSRGVPTQRRFQELTGIKKTSKPFREAFATTVELYRQGQADVEAAAPFEEMKVVSVEPVANQVPPAPGVHDTLVWGDSGAVNIPEYVPLQAVDALKSIARVSESFHLSIGDKLRKQAQRAPSHQRAAATAVAEQLNELGNRTLSETRNINGELRDTFHPVAKMAGEFKFNRASLEAQSDGTVTDVPGGVRAIEANISDFMEGRKPLSEASPRLREFVDRYKKLTHKRGEIAEREGVRRNVPGVEQPIRRALLDQKTTDELKAEFKKLLPNDKLPGSREKILDRMQRYEFFRNVGDGGVFVRMGTPMMMQIRATGEGHRYWAPLRDALAELNGVEPATVEKDMQLFKVSHEKKSAVEIPRVFARFPTAIEVDGRRVDLLETNPFNHVVRTTDAFAKRLGNIRVFGDTISNKPVKKGKTHERVAPQDQLSNAAKQAGLDPSTVDSYLNGLAGHSIDKRAVDQGGEGATTSGLGHSLVSAIASSKMTLSTIPNLFEPLGNIRAFAGNKRLLRAALIQIKRDPNGALADVRRAGAYATEYANMTLNRQGWVSSLLNVYGNAALRLGLVRGAWNQQAELGAVAGKLLADDFRRGLATKRDKENLVRYLGYSEAEANALFDRSAAADKYIELIQRFAARSNSTQITNPVEESSIRGNRVWRAFMPLTRFALLKTRDLANVLGTTWQDGIRYKATRSPEDGARLARSLGETANYLGGMAAAGALTNIVRSAIYYGPEEGLGLALDDWRQKPFSMALDSLASGALGWFVGTAYWNMKQTKDPKDILYNVSVSAGIAGEAGEAVWSIGRQAMGKLGIGRYRNLTPLQTAAAWYSAVTPIARAANTQTSALSDYLGMGRFLMPFSLGQQDNELNAARIRMFRFLDDAGRGPGSGEPGGLPDEQATYMRHMHAFTQEARKIDAGGPERSAIMEQHLLAALGAESKDPQQIAASIRGRKLVNYFYGDEQLINDFATKYPEQFEKLLEHDQVLENWALLVKPRSR